MNNNEINLQMTAELAGAIGSDKLTDKQVAMFHEDPCGFLEKMKLQSNGVDVQTVENSTSEVHIALPYYSEVDQLSSKSLSDETVEDVSGGEIIINLIALGVVAGAVVGATYGIAKEAAIGGRDDAFREITGEEFPGGK